MTGAGGRRRTGLIVALVVVVAFGAGFAYVIATDEPREVFCTLGLAFVEADGRSMALEDQGGPGPGDCDGSRVMKGMHVLGFDCKVRNPDGDVVAEMEPNQPEGRCGQSIDGAPFPASWNTA